MSKGTGIGLTVIGGVAATLALLLAGVGIGRSIGVLPHAGWQVGTPFGAQRLAPFRDSLMGSGMMGYAQMAEALPYGMMGAGPMGSGMMGSGMMGPSIMGSGMTGPGMMGSGMMGPGVAGSGMMAWSGFQPWPGVEPIEVSEARSAAGNFVQQLDAEGLEIGEIMIFDNHGYVQVVETDTGIGAFELLVDPVTLAASYEHGPAMMWNLKYGGMGTGPGFAGVQRSLMNEMMGQSDVGAGEPVVEPEQAVEIAQRYLDTYLLGTKADEYADPFYGYYTLHILRDGEVVGMLSVNSVSGQVWPHTWHGELLEIAGHEETRD